MTIYLDAVWLLNFFLDWMILMLTQYIAKSTSKSYRLALAAAFASMLVPITLFYPQSIVTHPIGKVLFSIVILLIAFGFKNSRRFSRLFLLFYFVSFALGGSLFGIYYFLNQQIQLSGGVVLTYQTGFGDGVSWLFVFLGFPVVWWFTKRRVDNLVTEKLKYDEMLQVTISLNKEERTTTSLVDSGNQLVDPITKRPIVICDKPFLSQWFTDDEWESLQQSQEDLAFERLPEEWQHAVRLIPYQGVSGQKDFMLALKPDYVLVHTEDKQLKIERVLIGIQFSQLSNDQSYQCLLHPHLLKTLAVHSA
ncbi:stage II sporulation protein GA [Pontibacillus halophilus JSM 076056 = DSM 19796]|uniref:Sporulation sigma-E factor-processing peptidase n=1 Tax=Pontibacillus halophilus JSM 076056 = DSM 19796 TaxID=1385510 RepID=A0A0A5GMN0_9BACI|nr:sigma-E processing peptidase SpoIIGA [Pontibacillus halophilus]KGX93254.1 stage II sporulation protein GA [Pontibacillus halophilus JSM 076056 = DSM 19796]